MAYEQRDNSGTVFENDRKERDTHPDFKGKAMIGGVMYWASMWVKEKDDGEEFFSFSFKPMEESRDQQRPPARQERQEPQRQSRRVPVQGTEQRPAQRQPQRASSGFEDIDDDIPW